MPVQAAPDGAHLTPLQPDADQALAPFKGQVADQCAAPSSGPSADVATTTTAPGADVATPAC